MGEGFDGDRIGRITSGQPQYPALLKEIRDFPKELFYIGDVAVLKKRCAAVVGSRKTTQYGRSTAAEIGKQLVGKGVAVVSGMAAGIDSCAHQGALRAGGKTIAVLASGVDVCYPPENMKLKKQIEENGLVLSEYPPGMMPQRYFFPHRNRIISGLSEITVVVQAGSRSGALITAELAAEQGREVCAVPGNIDSRYNLGNNKLIREGVTPIAAIGDILELLDLHGINEERAAQILSRTEKIIFDFVSEAGETTVDELCFLLSKPPGYVQSILSVMEMKGVLFSDIGKIFIAKG